MSDFSRLHAKSLVLALMLPIVAFAAPRQEPGRSLRFVGNDKIPPILFVQNEKPAGLAVDLAYALAEKAHVLIRVEAMDWPKAQSLVSAGKADALLQINATPERELIYDFSDTLLESRFHIFRKNTRLDIQNLSSLFGKKVGVEAGGFPIQYLQAYDQIQLIVVPSWKDGFERLHAEQLDAVFVDRWVGEYDLYLHKITGVTLVDPPVVTNYSRIAVKKGNRELLDRINSGLKEIERDGTRQSILRKWQSKEVVYVTREWIKRMERWVALVCVALLIVITQRALAHSRALKKINRELAERSDALTREIEERKQAEAALQRAHDTLEQHVAERTAELRQSEERWRLFVEHAPAAIAMFDLKMRYLAVSQRWMDDFQLALQPVLGRSHYDVFPEVPERWKEIHRRCLSGAIERAEEDPFTRADGQVQWLCWEVRPWHDAEDKIGGIIIFSEDITERKRAEEALRESEERYRLIVETANEGIWVTDGERRTILVNQRMADMLGYTADELQGRIPGEFLHAGQEPVVLKARQALAVGTATQYEFRFRRKDGSDLWVVSGATPVRDNEGRLIKTISMLTDITERKRAEQELERMRNLLAEGQRVAHVGSFEYVAATRTTVWSEEECRIYGLDPAGPSPAYDVMLAKCIHPDDAALLHETFSAAMESNSVYELEHRLVQPDGSVRWVYDRALPYFDDRGNLLRYVGATLDITERKRVEEQLRESREDLERAQAVGQVGSWRLDTRLNILTWSDENHRIFGLPKGTPMSYETFLSTIHPDDRQYVDTQWQAGVRGAPYDIEHRIVVADQVKWVREKAYLEFDAAGQLLGGFGITQDITARKQAEEALRAVNESLEQRVTERTAEVRRQADQLRALAAELTQAEQRERKRLAKVLHDHIQQLLVAARMQMGWMQRDSRPERLQATLQGVDSILKEALDASRSLTVELSPPVLHEAGLIGGLNWLAARTLERSQFEVILRAENRAEPSTEDARLLLFECARELLLNAVKHSGVSQAHVTLLRTNDGFIKLIIGDEGKGFDPDLLKKRRPDEASFGLFSVQQRLIHIGGQMEIATAPGKGTRVTLTLPVGEAPPLSEEPGSTARNQAKPDKIVVREKTAMRRILIVDDHKIMRDGLVSLMQFESDIEVVGQAADGHSAIELAARLQPDAIIMDVNLGDGMNGVEATKQILSTNLNIKIIGLSMHTDNDVATALRDAGAVAYLTKGGPSEDLIAAIRAACAR
jgi:PAS domain S-box-containing protein